MNNNYERCLYLILSIGTGKNMQFTRFQGRGISRCLNDAKFARNYAMDCDQAHQQMLREEVRSTFKFNHYRLNVEPGLELMKLDEWRARGPLKMKLGSIIGKSRARPSKAVPQQIQASVGKEVQPQNGQLSSDIRSVQNGNQLSENFQNESDKEGPTEPNSAPLITENGVGAAGPMSGASSQRHSTPIDSTAIPRWLQPKNRTLEDIRKHTMAYLEKDEVKKWPRQCAGRLVKSRRNRVKSSRERWERTCFSIRYECNVNRCRQADRKYTERKNLEQHLSHEHGEVLGPDDAERRNRLNSRLDACKITVN